MTFASTTRLTPTFGRGILFACFGRRSRLKAKYAFLDRAFRSRSCAVQQMDFGHEKPDHANAPNEPIVTCNLSFPFISRHFIYVGVGINVGVGVGINVGIRVK